MDMETIEKKVADINALVAKAYQKEYTFVENELEPLIVELFSFPKEALEKNIKIIKPLFKKIICMHKSTGAFGFYKLLAECNLSFSEGLLMYGIDHEPYYNNNDDVFIGWLMVASRNTELEDVVNVLLQETEISHGHFFDYKVLFKRAFDLRPNIEHHLTVPENIRRQILHSIGSGDFYQRLRKAIAVAIFLEVTESISFIEKKFWQTRQKMIDLKGQNFSLEEKRTRARSCAELIIQIRELSFALFCLVGEETFDKYHDFYEFANSKKISVMDVEEDEKNIQFFEKVFNKFNEIFTKS
jgi:hypothetical protein